MKNKLRLRFVASTMLMIASGCSFFTYPLVILSSDVNGDIEYAPGRSTAISSFELSVYAFLIGLSFLSTVTPAQFPIFSFRPVSALYIVVLPLFGFPVNAILIMFPPS